MDTVDIIRYHVYNSNRTRRLFFVTHPPTTEGKQKHSGHVSIPTVTLELGIIEGNNVAAVSLVRGVCSASHH